jgi:hypothetical protein
MVQPLTGKTISENGYERILALCPAGD